MEQLNISHSAFSICGKRNNNEDTYEVTEGACFIVCDGVGGSEKGEVASRIVVQTFKAHFVEGQDLDVAMAAAHDKLDEHSQSHPASLGMATTLAMLQMKNGNAHVAWCGDSRIYQFREGAIINRTEDHSWVNDAVKAGILTKEEAIGHPKANMITRAIQEGAQKRSKLDVQSWGKVDTGDAFLICSDGVLESWSDDELVGVMSGGGLKSITDTIRAKCEAQSRDNSTAILVLCDARHSETHEAFGSSATSTVPARRQRGNLKTWLLIGSTLIGMAIGLWYVLQEESSPSEQAVPSLQTPSPDSEVPPNRSSESMKGSRMDESQPSQESIEAPNRDVIDECQEEEIEGLGTEAPHLPSPGSPAQGDVPEPGSPSDN